MQAQFGNHGRHDLALGSVRGFRWYSLGPDGHLTGAQKQRWTPGENVAACLMCAGREPRDVHEAGEVDCTCGFYAYWERPDDDALHRSTFRGVPVAGVIEGYGRTVIGDLGFRCEKARILGLHIMAFDRFAQGNQQLADIVSTHVTSAYGVALFGSVSELTMTFPLTQEYARGAHQAAHPAS